MQKNLLNFGCRHLEIANTDSEIEEYFFECSDEDYHDYTEYEISSNVLDILCDLPFPKDLCDVFEKMPPHLQLSILWDSDCRYLFEFYFKAFNGIFSNDRSKIAKSRARLN